ncbi:unnamed protein product [Prunus armeniaca]
MRGCTLPLEMEGILKAWQPSKLMIYLCMREPQPAYSAYREASFGHAIFNIKNRTHDFYGWLDDVELQ